MRVNRGRSFLYRSDPDQRQPEQPDVDDKTLDFEHDDVELTFLLPAVPRTIRPGRDSFVAEVVFTLQLAGFPSLNWRAH